MRLNQHKDCVEFTERYPIHTTIYPEWKTLNPKLEDAIRTAGDAQQYRTNVQAFMTEWNMWDDANPGAKHFQEVCAFACDVSVEQSPVEFRPVVTNCWGAIYKRSEYTKTHNHWPAVWSFTYYVKVGEGAAPIAFPTAGKAVFPQNGTLCLFPGWVDHSVPPHDSDDERIMVAGNIAFSV